MAVTIVNVSDFTFSINGIEYQKNFTGIVSGDNVKIINTYDSKIVLQQNTNYADYTVNGASYVSAALLQSALVGVLFSSYQQAFDVRLGYLEENQITGVQVYGTFASLPGTGTLLVSYKVSNDSTPANNGYYHWSGSAYVKDIDLNNGTIEPGNIEAVKGGDIYDYLTILPDLLEGATYKEGFYLDNDIEVSFVSFKYTTNFIPVDPSSIYIKSQGAAFSGCFYDITQTLINNIVTVDLEVDSEFTTPANCAFVRMNVAIAESDPYVRKIAQLTETKHYTRHITSGMRQSISGNTGILGDSTVAAYLGQQAISHFINFSDTLTDIAVPGDTINDQLADWNILSGAIKSAMDWVIVQIGLNDLNPATPIATTVAQYQTLIDAISADAPSAKIICCTMTPARQRLINLYGESGYQKWLDLNNAIRERFTTNIVGIDRILDIHTELLSNGGDNLDLIYDLGDFIHEDNVARMIIANNWVFAMNQINI